MMGGYFESQITVAGASLINTGGETDFFIAKYGASNCGCSIPLAGYSANINPSTHVGIFTYTGTTPVDSVRWSFGDGTASNQMNPTHTFTNGHFNVCVTAYNNCGNNQYCGAVSLSIASLAALGTVKVYPNPSHDYRMVDGVEGGCYTITNTIGQRMACGALRSKEQVNTSALPSGTYLLQLINAKGGRGAMPFVKQ